MSKKDQRDDFNPRVIYMLYTRAGGLCSICKRPTFGPAKTSDPTSRKPFTIGEAAHICAAAEGGPRYDRDMTANERTGSQNGMWLCVACHRQIDRDPESYSKECLREKKQKAEKSAEDRVGMNPEELKMGNSEVQKVLDGQAIYRIRLAENRISAKMESTLVKQVIDEVAFLEFDSYHIRVWLELTAFYAKLASVTPGYSSAKDLFFIWNNVLRSLDNIVSKESNPANIERLLENVLATMDGIREHSKQCSTEDQKFLLKSLGPFYKKLTKLVPQKKDVISCKIPLLKGLVRSPSPSQPMDTDSSPWIIKPESTGSFSQLPSQPRQGASEADKEVDQFFDFLAKLCATSDQMEVGERKKWETKGYTFQVQ